MKRFSATYYLLFVILITGAFAAMAQNDYGTLLLGLVAVAFSFIFLLQLISASIANKSAGWLNRLELISLILMAALIALRVFYVHFSFVEIVFGVAGAMLTVVYIVKLIGTFQSLRGKSKMLSSTVALFHLSIIFFTLSMTVVPFLPKQGEPLGMLGFALLVAFLFLALLTRKVMVDGEQTSTYSYVIAFKDRSVLMGSLFLAFALYAGLTRYDLIPKMYSDEFPQSYLMLVKEAEFGQEKPVNGKYKHQEFKAMYDRFVERNITPK